MPPLNYGRNDPCWCGSGKKYKKCHLTRQQQTPTAVWEASKEHIRAFSVPTCLAPVPWQKSCSKKISRAHTVPKSGSLSRIARNGHVYGIIPTIEHLFTNDGRILPKLIGINRASSFTGFCSRHDDLIFSPIEKREFSGSPEQCFLLGYRALCREIFTKQAALSLSEMRSHADAGKPFERQVQIQAFNKRYEMGLYAGARDGERFKKTYDEALKNRKFTDVRGYVIELADIPPVMCSGAYFPEEDFDGRLLQDIGDLDITPHLLTVTSFYGGKHGTIALSWLQDSSETCDKFIHSLDRISDNDIANALLALFFEHIENIYISPEWWDNLHREQRTQLLLRLNTSFNPLIARQQNYLKSDHYRFLPWSIHRRYTVGH